MRLGEICKYTALYIHNFPRGQSKIGQYPAVWIGRSPLTSQLYLELCEFAKESSVALDEIVRLSVCFIKNLRIHPVIFIEF